MQKRGSSLFHIGREIEKALKERSLADGLLPHRARAMWSEVVGEDVAAATIAETVRGGVLFVKVRSSVWANELTFYKAEMLRKLNQKVGAPVLTDIHFTVASRGKAAKDTWPDAHTNRETAAIEIHVEAPSADAVDAGNTAAELTVADRLRDIRDRAAKTYAAKRALGWAECTRCGALFDPKADEPGRMGAREPRHQQVCPLCSTLARSAY